MNSKNIQVQELLDDVKMSNDENFEIFEKLRELTFGIFPNVSEKIMYGGIMFTLENDWGGIFLRKNHISFEFSKGFEFDDPGKILEGGGKFRRHLKLRSLEDIDIKKVLFYIQQVK